jgi:prepilin-type N-terminal cleavage/methylation domain-containing protein
MRRHAKGFTVTELLIVVLVLGIAALVAIPDFSSNPHKLDLTAAEVAEAVRFARSESVRTGVPHGVFTQGADNRIRVFRADTGTTPPTPVYDVRNPIDKKLYDIDFDTHPFAAGVDISGTASFQGTCNDERYVVFDATGAPRCLDPMTVILRASDKTLASSVSTRVVTIHGFTGRVTIQ